MKVRNLQKLLFWAAFGLGFRANVKKVRTPRLQRLDPGEIAFGDFPFRLLKSRK